MGIIEILLGPEHEWAKRAACKGHDPVIFDGDERWPDLNERAKEICADCPVRGECLKTAMEEEAGLPAKLRACISGGLTPGERKHAEMRGELLADDIDIPFTFKIRRIKRGSCPLCGKASMKQKILSKRGILNQREQVILALEVEAENWKPDFTHRKCRQDRRVGNE